MVTALSLDKTLDYLPLQQAISLDYLPLTQSIDCITWDLFILQTIALFQGKYSCAFYFWILCWSGIILTCNINWIHHKIKKSCLMYNKFTWWTYKRKQTIHVAHFFFSMIHFFFFFNFHGILFWYHHIIFKLLCLSDSLMVTWIMLLACLWVPRPLMISYILFQWLITCNVNQSLLYMEITVTLWSLTTIPESGAFRFMLWP